MNFEQYLFYCENGASQEFIDEYVETHLSNDPMGKFVLSQWHEKKDYYEPIEISEKEILRKGKESETLFFFPLSEKTASMTKEETIKEIEAFFCETIPKDVPNYATELKGRKERAEKIINDYKSYSFEHFVDYIRYKEDEFFSEMFYEGEFSLNRLESMATLNINNNLFRKMMKRPHGKDSYKFSEIKQYDEMVNIVDIVFLILSVYNDLLHPVEDSEYKKYYKEQDDGDIAGQQWRFVLFDAFLDYFFALVKDIMAPPVSDKITYISSNRVSIRRLYSLSYEDEFARIIGDYFNAKRTYAFEEGDYEEDSYMNKWAKKLEIADSIVVEPAAEGLGALIYLCKKKKKRLAADVGFGITQIISLLLQIETAILSRKDITNEREYLNHQWGEEYPRVFASQTIILEEPEAHLHPKFQSLIADMLFDALHQYGIHFIVETHSEYLVRKSQVLVAQQKFADDNELAEKNQFMVYYFPTNGLPYEMKYRTDGNFSNEFSSGFYDEANSLLFEIL